jgi:hypothetical protein
VGDQISTASARTHAVVFMGSMQAWAMYGTWYSASMTLTPVLSNTLATSPTGGASRPGVWAARVMWSRKASLLSDRMSPSSHAIASTMASRPFLAVQKSLASTATPSLKATTCWTPGTAIALAALKFLSLEPRTGGSAIAATSRPGS